MITIKLISVDLINLINLIQLQFHVAITIILLKCLVGVQTD